MGLIRSTWTIVITVCITVISIIVIVLLATSLRDYRKTILVCSLSKPRDCTPDEFDSLCSDDALDAQPTQAYRDSLENSCKWACDQLNTRSDMCQFKVCYTTFDRQDFINTCL